MKVPVLAGVVLATCASCGVRPRAPVIAPPSTSVVRAGLTSFRPLPPEPAPPGEGGEQITAAFASDRNWVPLYPTPALEAGCNQGIVAVRLLVGKDGNVGAVVRVPGRPVAEDPCHAAFWEATRATVGGWSFSPAFRQTPRPGHDLDGDGRPDLTEWDQAPVPVYLDFEFAFRVVEGRGQVEAAPPTGSPAAP